MMIRLAHPSDAEALMNLRIEAEQWLANAGIDQWRNPETRGPALEKWKTDIAAGRTWVVEEQGLAVATVTLASADRDFWNASDCPDNALYVAKLITARSVSGRNLGGQLLDWVGSQARQRGKSWVRLDCWRTNTKLQEFYLAEGFQHVRTETPDHRLSGWLGQRASSVVRHAEPLLTERKQAIKSTASLL
ncbi:GNAT family N-acetyltransferase [[Kitasatospora] papulosa]|uniref:GNAT family N-acetyltransferase n=1 Tax=Streptomyces TaxID=1883 RepID=UPI0022581456|nr:GNAT family N-acetyltransferase [[Kitasatospora] papulosa]MCX4417840.1 GNAT family N-acetyltransferase [[Kitasatospora] papulosa]